MQMKRTALHKCKASSSTREKTKWRTSQIKKLCQRDIENNRRVTTLAILDKLPANAIT